MPPVVVHAGRGVPRSLGRLTHRAILAVVARICALVIGVAVLGGCDRVYGLHHPPATDAEIVSDAPTCFGTGLVELCLLEAPTRSLVFPHDAVVTIDTATGICESYAGAPGWCVISGGTVAVDGTLRGTGPLPLVLIATDTLTVTGSIDVSSQNGIGAGGEPAACPSGLGGNANSGGGAGGTFGGRGGGGGTSATGGQGGTSAAVPPITTLRGGCHGGGGANTSGNAGHGGGAIYLIADGTITIAGTIDASGGGGLAGPGATIPGGGGGGGAGGMIGLDAPAIEITGSVFANGGGGGEGGGDPASGAAGDRPMAPGTPAKGGGGSTINGGDGGDGAAGANTTGTNGRAGTASSSGGGGGGGGGGGILRIYPRQPTGINVSPPPT